MPGKKAWAAKLDAVVFADGGNVVDCLMLACRAALWDTKVPRTKGVEYRAPRREGTQGDVGMDVDVDEEDEDRGGLETKNVSRATDFELSDYWDEGASLSGRESWPVCVTLNVVRSISFVPSSRITPSLVDTCVISCRMCTFWTQRYKKKRPYHCGCMPCMRSQEGNLSSKHSDWLAQKRLPWTK